MKEVLEICLGAAGLLVGTLQYEAAANREYSCFRYAQSWLESADAFALTPALSLNDNRFFFSGEHPLPPAFMDTLPDSWGKRVLMRDARQSNANQVFNPCCFLLSVPDIFRIGALRIRHAGGDFLAQGTSELLPRLLHLSEFCATIRDIEMNTPETSLLRQFVFAGSSLGGARPKCSVLDDGSMLAVAKFTSHADTRAVETAEVMTLCLARMCGITTPEARLLEGPPGLPIALIRRFDRAGKVRIPYISAQSMLDSRTADDGSYTAIADAIRAHGANPKADLKELFRRILFTILVSNVDDHLKNHGFLYAGNNKWRLSPVFDVNPFPEKVKKLKTKIADDSNDSASVELLLEHAFYFEISNDDAATMAATMSGIIKEHWVGLARQLGMNDSEIAEYRPAFEHSEINFAAAVAGQKTAGLDNREEDEGLSPWY